MKLVNFQPFPLGFQCGKEHIEVPPQKDEKAPKLTAAQTDTLLKYYSVTQLKQYGVISVEDSPSSPKIGPAPAADTTAAAGASRPAPPVKTAAENTGDAPAMLTLREIQALVKKGMTREDAEKLLEVETNSAEPRDTVLKELKKVLA